MCYVWQDILLNPPVRGRESPVSAHLVVGTRLNVGESDRPAVNLTVWGPTATFRCCNASVAALGVGIPDAIAPYKIVNRRASTSCKLRVTKLTSAYDLVPYLDVFFGQNDQCERETVISCFNTALHG